jgi:hypothetical protein
MQPIFTTLAEENDQGIVTVVFIDLGEVVTI